MKFKNPMFVVADMDKTVAFYKKVLGLHVILDFGANKTLTGGLCLQTLETWKTFIGTDEIAFGGNNAEIYFEEDDFDAFAEKLKKFDMEYVHPVKAHSWGQRAVRFYDPDKHIVEMIELPDHPWFVACQFHPEFKSRPNRPHPLFRGLIAAAVKRRQGR